MREKKSEQQHYHSRDDYDHISSSSSSTYIQLRNNKNNALTFPKSKQSLFNFTHIRSYLIIFLFIFLLLFFIFFIQFPTEKTTHTYVNHRLKRDIPLSNHINKNDKQHYTKMLRRILLHRTSSSVLADCTINMALDGIYRLPLENSLSSEIIHLVEKTFFKEFHALKQTANKIRNKINHTTNVLGDFGLAKFGDEFSISLRLLLASQLSIKEINIMLAPPSSNDNNGGSYIYYDTIKYSRLNNETLNKNSFIDYDSISDTKLKQGNNIILQTFTPSNARETLKQTIYNNSLINDGWWIGPVLCEKNKNETFLMAHIFPLTTR